MPTDGTELQAIRAKPETQKILKKEANRRRFAEALERALEEAEEKERRDDRNTTAPATVERLYQLALLLAQLVNASFTKMSHERAGGRSRFVDQGVLCSSLSADNQLTEEQLSLIGRRFEDEYRIWRVLSEKENAKDNEGNILDGVFIDAVKVSYDMLLPGRSH
mmetsp:Transcript_14240/g.43121  ORF Transcript_14240/g.43121 Transcript_14240/m.43121 type:complete len:164 (-) Transcript_14240:222-713(-)